MRGEHEIPRVLAAPFHARLDEAGCFEDPFLREIETTRIELGGGAVEREAAGVAGHLQIGKGQIAGGGGERSTAALLAFRGGLGHGVYI